MVKPLLLRQPWAAAGALSLALAASLATGVAHAAESAPPTGEPVRDLERITLKVAIQRALARNPRVETQLEEVHRAEAQVAQTRSASLPTLTGNGNYTRFDDARKLGDTVLAEANALNLNVTVAVPLLAPQRWVKWAQANQNARAVALSAGDIKRQVAINVSQAYLAIIARRREVELNVRARDVAKTHFDYTHARLLGGMGSRLDDVRAQQELEQDESAVEAAVLALARAQEALGVLIGGDVAVDTAEEPWVEAIDADRAVANAPKLRADLIELEARVELARRISRDNWADYMPTLTASFAPIYTYPGTIFTPTFSWQAQLNLTIPLYDGGLRYGQARERHVAERQARIAEEAALRQTRSDLRLGNEATRRTEVALTRARAAAQLAHEAVKIADLSYHAGATTNIELIDAERRARDADTAAAIAEDAARQARLDLAFAAGVLP